jgi:hypothetical protein
MLIAAQGDSWFDYPGADVLSMLELRKGVEVASCAHRGDTLEAMAYAPDHGRKLARLFEGIKRQRRRPDAVLLSAGGNDVAGDELALLLNHAAAALPTVSPEVLAGVMLRLEVAFRTLCFGVTGLCRHFYGAEVPIILHGYGYAVPDGRGFMGGGGILPGPWLRPSLHRKGHLELERGFEIMQGLIDHFALMLCRVTSTPGLEHVRAIDLRPTLAAVPGRHQTLWADELHPSERGFGLVAEVFYRAVVGE